MTGMRIALSALMLSGFAAFGADASLSKVYDGMLKSVEGEAVSLAEAMPADKFDFAPTDGAFKGVRTFGQQARHMATIVYLVSSSVLEEKCPVDLGENENGAATLKGKDAIVKYLKDSFVYAHKAMAGLTEKNQMDLVAGFGNRKSPRVNMASAAVWHSFDHYGQMVVYARMNGVIPPASR